MSGGSYNYACYTIENEYIGKMFDKELNVMMADLSKLLHDLEWWQSGDIGEEQYKKIVKQFKNRWFESDSRISGLKEIIKSECEQLKEELINMIAISE